MTPPNSSASMQLSSQSRKAPWDDKNLSTSFADVCNVSCSGEDITLLFGRTEPGLTEGEWQAKLTDRIHLTPSVAKELAKVSQTVLSEHVKRYGAFKG